LCCFSWNGLRWEWVLVPVFALCGFWNARFAWRSGGYLTRSSAAGSVEPGLAVRLGFRRTLRPGRRRVHPPAVLLAAVALLSIVSGCFLLDRLGPSVAFAGAYIAVSILIALAVIDARSGYLPDALTLPLMWLGLAMAWGGHGQPASDALAGAMLGYVFLRVLFEVFRRLTGREGMGYGDFKLAAALGAWLGPSALLHALVLACLAGTAYACWRRAFHGGATSYPFGPFLAFGALPGLAGFTELQLPF